MELDISFVNNDIIINQLSNYVLGVEDRLQKTIFTSLLAIERNAKINCPTDLGGLKQSITAFQYGSGTIGGAVECMEAHNPPYGAYVEFGTGDKVQVPEGLEQYAMGFFVNGKGHMPAHPFLFPAFFAEQDNLLDNLQIAMAY